MKTRLHCDWCAEPTHKLIEDERRGWEGSMHCPHCTDEFSRSCQNDGCGVVVVNRDDLHDVDGDMWCEGCHDSLHYTEAEMYGVRNSDFLRRGRDF